MWLTEAFGHRHSRVSPGAGAKARMTCRCGRRSQELDAGVHLSSAVVRNASGYRTASDVFFINFENKSRLKLSSILCPQ